MENQNVEYKREISSADSFKAEIVAFLNSAEGGKIYIGVDDEGNPIHFKDEESKLKKFKEWEEKISNWIDNSFEPDIRGLVKVEPTLSYIILNIEPGLNKPYNFKSHNKSKYDNIFIRHGSSKRKASSEEIKRMMRKHNSHSFDSEEIEVVTLDFDYINKAFKNKGIAFDEIRLGLRKIKPNSYNNAALILSDDNPHISKAAIFNGNSVENFKDRKKFSGSIAEQIDDCLKYISFNNHTQAIITGKSQREELSSYPESAIREALINAYVHRDYTLTSDIRVEIFDNRLEISSPGSLPDGLTIEDIKQGQNAKRNAILVDTLDKVDYIENYGSGIRRIFESYKRFSPEPELIATYNQFKVILFNRNYKNDSDEEKIIKFLEIHDEVTRQEVQDALSLKKNKTINLLNVLVKNHRIVKTGKSRSVRYKLSK